MIKNTYKLALLLAPCLLLSACSGDKLQDKLGLKRTVPDEFSVVKHAPLVMPPEYTLRPPNPGEKRPQEKEIIHEARAAVFGEISTQQPEENNSNAEDILLQQAGAADVTPDIRSIVDKEAKETDKGSKYIGKKLLGLSGLGDDSADYVIDPKEELKRLRQNSTTAKPAINDETAPL